MRIQYLIPFILLFLLINSSCSNKNKAPICVTYKVTIHAQNVKSISLTYRDDSGEINTTINQNWSEEVCLTGDNYASLVALVEYTDDFSDLFMEKRMGVTAQIIHKDTTVTERGQYIIPVRLFTFGLKN